MAFKHTIPPSRPDMGRWGIENTGCCFEPMRDILPITQKHIYILFHNNHFQSKNAAWPIFSPVSSACSISYAAYDNTNFSVHGSKRFTRGLQRAFPYIHVAAPETEASDGTLLRLSAVLPYSIFDKKSGRFPFRFCYEDR